MKFFEELKRRNVVRVGVAYLVVAWLVLQVVDTVAPMLVMPCSFGRGVLRVIVIGGRIVVVISWGVVLRERGVL